MFECIFPELSKGYWLMIHEMKAHISLYLEIIMVYQTDRNYRNNDILSDFFTFIL